MLNFVVQVLCGSPPSSEPSASDSNDHKPDSIDVLDKPEAKGRRQVWLKGWAEDPMDAAWIIEEGMRKESMLRLKGGYSTVKEGWHTKSKDGWLHEAMFVDENWVEQYKVHVVEVEN